MNRDVRHTLDRARQLKGLIDEVVDADWRHPSWWLLCAGVAVLETRAPGPTPDDPIAAVRDHYIKSSGAPRNDAIMARQRAAPRDPGARIADAVTAARAALDTLCDLHGQFPGQPLDSFLTGGRRDLQPALLGGDRRRVAFAGARGAVVTTLGRDPAGDVRLAASLAGFLRHGRVSRELVPVTAHAPATRAALTVSIGDESLDTARHLHRRAWTADGGPWLGVGTTRAMQAVTTCHIIVDGYGHARISAEIFRRQDQLARRWSSELAAAASDAAGDAAGNAAGDAAGGFDPFDLPRLPEAVPLGIATAHLDATAPDFAAAAHALGRALEQHLRGHMAPGARRGFRFSPTFQVPVAHGTRGDPGRWRRRVMNGLLSVHMSQGSFEPLERFRSRLPVFLDRERAGMGLLMRVHQAVSHAPVPISLKRRFVSRAATPRPWLPALEALSSRCALSLLRFAPGEQAAVPLYAASASSPDASPADPRGSSVLTLVPGATGIAVTMCGTGDTGTERGARVLLERWLERYMAAGSVK